MSWKLLAFILYNDGNLFGQTLFPLPSQYLYGAHAVMLVYDVTTPTTLDALQDWVSVVRSAARHHERPPLMALVANKADLEHLRQVKKKH